MEFWARSSSKIGNDLKRAIFITAAELLIGLALKPVGLDNLFVAVVCSFVALSAMLIAEKVKNCRIIENSKDDN